MAEDYSSQGGGTYSGTAFSSGGSGSSATAPKKEDLKFGFDPKTGIQYDPSGKVISTPGETTKSIERIVQPGISATDKPGELEQKAAAIGVGASTTQIEQRMGREEYLKTLTPEQKQQAELKSQLLRSPTAQFASQEAAQEAYSSSTLITNIKPENVQAKIIPTVKPDSSFLTQGFDKNYGQSYEIFHPEIKEQQNVIVLSQQESIKYQASLDTQIGKYVLTPSEQSSRALRESGFDISKLNLVEGKGEIWREYIGDAPLSFQINEFLRNTAANVGSFNVLSKNVQSFLGASHGKERPEDVSNYLKAREGYFESVSTIKASDTSPYKIATLARMSIESPVIQAEVGGYVIGGIFAGASAIARFTLSGAAKETSSIIGFAESKLPTTISKTLFPEVAPTGFTVERGLTYAGKIPSLMPAVLKTGEKLVEPTLVIGGLGYIGYDIATSETRGEVGAKIALLGAGIPYAKTGFETGSQLIAKARLIGTPRISEEGILNPRVEAGKETFPTTHAGSFEKFKQEFVNPEGELSGFHATSEGYGSEGFVVKGLQKEALRKHDVPGLYISPVQEGASTAFLRLPGTKGYEDPFSLKSFFSSSPLRPEIYKIGEVSDIQRIHGGRNVEKSREFLYSDKPELGTAYIEPKMELGGFRGEAQAVLPQGTEISSPLKTFKVNVKGFDVKYTERKILSGEQKVSSVNEFNPENIKTEQILSERSLTETPLSRQLISSRISSDLESSISTSESSLISLKEQKSSRISSDSKVSSSNIFSSEASSILEQSSKIFSSSRIASSSLFNSSLLVESSRKIEQSSKVTPSSRIMPSSRIVPDSYIEQPPELPKYSSINNEIFPERKKEKVPKRKVREYQVKNIFAELEDVIAAPNTPKGKKSKKDSFELPEFEIPDFGFETTQKKLSKKKSTKRRK